MMTNHFVAEIRIGRVQPLGPKDVPSGIDKQPVSGSIFVDVNGLCGDEQGDRRHHGGPDKAVHAYSSANYPVWAADLPNQAALFRAGAFGENLVVEGAAEPDICLGDRWRFGDALLEVSQGRQPCWRLNLRFGRSDMARRVQSSGRTGWYYRVIAPGEIRANTYASLEQRPNPAWTIARVSHLLYHDKLNMPDLAELVRLPNLPKSWRSLVQARLSNGRTEDWSNRIETPE